MRKRKPQLRSTVARGYGKEHQRLRASLVPVVAAGLATCARCGQPIPPGTPWDLGHTADRTAYTGVEHRACNRAAGARTRNAMRRPPPHYW